MAKPIWAIRISLFLAVLATEQANATCSWTTLTNGTTANADQVMNNLG